MSAKGGSSRHGAPGAIVDLALEALGARLLADGTEVVVMRAPSFVGCVLVSVAVTIDRACHVNGDHTGAGTGTTVPYCQEGTDMPNAEKAALANPRKELRNAGLEAADKIIAEALEVGPFTDDEHMVVR